MSGTRFILERSLLEPADIILTGEKTWRSLGVRAATASRYSHAALYVGGRVIEATLKGVFSKNAQRMLFDRPGDVLVLRSKAGLTMEINPWRYDPGGLVLVTARYGNPSEGLALEFGREPRMCARFMRNLRGHVASMGRADLAFFRLHVQLYLDLLGSAARRLDALRIAAAAYAENGLRVETEKLLHDVRAAVAAGARAQAGAH